MNKILHTLTKLTFGKPMADALLMLRLIAEAVNNNKVANVARFVFGKLPAEWRHPEGPATEAEFVELIEAGRGFLEKLQATLKKA